MNGRQSVEINWALVLNILLLLVIILGAWFTTFSGPLNEKFISLSDANKASIAALAAKIDAQFDAQEKAVGLAIKSVENINKETDASLTRRFGAQDKVNDELKQALRDISAGIERRQVEVATKLDLAATRLEFLSEIKRVDQIAAKTISRDEVQSVWKLRETQLLAIQAAVSALEKIIHDHEHEDRVNAINAAAAAAAANAAGKK